MSKDFFLHLQILTTCMVYTGIVRGAKESFSHEEVLVSFLKELTT